MKKVYEGPELVVFENTDGTLIIKNKRSEVNTGISVRAGGGGIPLEKGVAYNLSLTLRTNGHGVLLPKGSSENEIVFVLPR